jgi:hypothetical protein
LRRASDRGGSPVEKIERFQSKGRNSQQFAEFAATRGKYLDE